MLQDLPLKIVHCHDLNTNVEAPSINLVDQVDENEDFNNEI
jgi:hypothetical protein